METSNFFELRLDIREVFKFVMTSFEDSAKSRIPPPRAGAKLGWSHKVMWRNYDVKNVILATPQLQWNNTDVIIESPISSFFKFIQSCTLCFACRSYIMWHLLGGCVDFLKSSIGFCDKQKGDGVLGDQNLEENRKWRHNMRTLHNKDSFPLKKFRMTNAKSFAVSIRDINK